MPAPSAFLLAQTAVVATSVVLLQMDWGSQSKDARKASPVMKSNGPVAPAAAAIPQEAKELTPAVAVQTEAPPPPPADAFELKPEEPPAAIPAKDPFPEPELAVNSAYDIAADSASNFDLKSERVVFNGNVRLKSKSFIVKADRLSVNIDPQKNQMRKLTATGNVHVTVKGDGKEPGYTGNAWEANFDPDTDIITLTGWPRIQGGGREHRALDATTKMMLTTVKPKLTTQGRASTLITGQMKGTGADEKR